MIADCTRDLWEYLADSKKAVVMYGMGNGADKILEACNSKNIPVCDFFASDGFVRGHSFHGKTVLTWEETKRKYGAENVIVLLAFGTSRPDVLQNIRRIAAEAELYAPDVPAFGNGLFDRAFFTRHKNELQTVYDMLSDEESKQILKNVVSFKLTGDIRFLLQAQNDAQTVLKTMICPHRLTAVADLGAYNGDTVRELLSYPGSTVKTVYAMEPDARNFKKLVAYAQEETRADIRAIQAGAWLENTRLCFDASGNRNASFEKNRSEVLSDKHRKTKEIEARTPDSVLDGAKVDYIKYDVEGSEYEALLGSSDTLRAFSPTLLVSLYHRNEDIFKLPLLIREKFPAYNRFYLRRLAGIPAWDLNLFCKKE